MIESIGERRSGDVGTDEDMEINDNPNVDAGNEDSVLKKALYLDVMGVFARRMAERRQRLP